MNNETKKNHGARLAVLSILALASLFFLFKAVTHAALYRPSFVLVVEGEFPREQNLHVYLNARWDSPRERKGESDGRLHSYDFPDIPAVIKQIRIDPGTALQKGEEVYIKSILIKTSAHYVPAPDQIVYRFDVKNWEGWVLDHFQYLPQSGRLRATDAGANLLLATKKIKLIPKLPSRPFLPITVGCAIGLSLLLFLCLFVLLVSEFIAAGKNRSSFFVKTLLIFAVILGWCLTIVSGYPGYINWDEWYELGNIFSHTLDDVQPPMQTVVWKFLIDLFGSCGLGQSLQYASALLVQTTLFWLAIAMFASKFRSRLLGILFTLTLAVHPAMLSYWCHIGKDTQMAQAIFITCALLYWAIEKRSILFLIFSTFFMFYGFTVRTNGPTAVLPLCLLWGIAFFKINKRSLRNWKEQSFLAVLALALFIGLTISNEIFYNVVIEVKGTRGVAGAATLWEDMKGISVRINRNIVPTYLYSDPKYSLEDITRTYSTENCDFTGLKGLIPSEDVPLLVGDWLKAITSYPAQYIQHRLSIMKNLFGYHAGPQNYAIFSGFHGGPQFPARTAQPEKGQELMESVNTLDPRLIVTKSIFLKYFNYFKDTMLFRPWVFIWVFFTSLA